MNHLMVIITGLIYQYLGHLLSSENGNDKPKKDKSEEAVKINRGGWILIKINHSNVWLVLHSWK